MYLLDTNICVFAIKNRPPVVLSRIREHMDVGLCVSTLTIAELEFGVSNSA